MKRKMIKLVSIIMTLSLLLGYFSNVTIVKAEGEQENTSFRFVDSTYGVQIDDVNAKELEILSDDVTVLDFSFSNLLILKECVNENLVKIHLLGSKGLLKTFELSSSDQWVLDITDMAAGNGSIGDIFTMAYRNSFKEAKEHADCIYTVKNPNGKYDLINIDTGKYYDYGFDSIIITNRNDVDDVIEYTKDEMIGLLDCHGEKLSDAIYTSYHKIRDNYYLVYGNDADGEACSGILSTDGVYTGELIYSNIQYIAENGSVSNMVVAEKVDGTILVIYPERGEEIDISYIAGGYWTGFKLGLNAVLLEEYSEYTDWTFLEKWSILDENGEKSSVASLFGGEYNTIRFSDNDIDMYISAYDRIFDDSNNVWVYEYVKNGVFSPDYDTIFDATQYAWIETENGSGNGYNYSSIGELTYVWYTLDFELYTYEIRDSSGNVIHSFQSSSGFCHNITIVGDYAIIQFEENVYRSIELSTKKERFIFDVESIVALENAIIGDNQYIQVNYTDDSNKIVNLKNGTSLSLDEYDGSGRVILDGESGVLLMQRDNFEDLDIMSPDFKIIMEDVIYNGSEDVVLNYVWKDGYRYTLSGELISDEQWKQKETHYNDEQLHRIYQSALLYRDCKYSYIDWNGNVVWDDDYYFLSQFYEGLGFYAQLGDEYDEELDDYGIVNIYGDKIISGRFSNRFVSRYSMKDILPWGEGIILQRLNGTYIFYDWTNYLEGDEGLEIVSTFPKVGATDVSLDFKDVEIEFNKAVNIFEGRGNITIKEYDTDETVLTYRMLSGSQLGQVVYKSSRNKKKVVLTNALTALEEGKTYYITIDSNCFSDFGNSDGVIQWLSAIEDKDTLYFSTNSGNVNFSYMTCAAACELGQYPGVVSGVTVGEFLKSENFEDEIIWTKGTSLYSDLFRKELKKYDIVAYVEPTIEEPGYMVLKNDEKKVMLYVCIDSVSLLGKSMSDDSISESFDLALEDYLNYLDAYAGYDVRVTGNYYGAIIASYISTITNTQAILFNNLDSVGTDAAYRNGYLSVRDFQGIDNQNSINYYNQYLKLFMSKQYDIYRTARLKNNNYGDSIVSVNSLYSYHNGGFELNDVLEEEMPTKVVRKSARTNQETINAVKDFFEKSFLSGAKNFIMKTGVELVLGSSAADSEPFSDILTSSREQVIYTGGAATGTDVYSGGFVNNVFYHSNGNAILNGANYQDIYVIKRTNGTVTINDTSSAAGTIKQKKELVKCITSTDGYNSLLLGLSNASELIKTMENGKDHVYLLDTVVDENSFVYNGSYYEMKTSSGMIRISPEWTTEVVVTGANGTETTIPSIAESVVAQHYSLKIMTDLMLQTFGAKSEIKISAMRIIGEDVSISLYDAQNDLIETVDTTCNDEYCSVRKYDNLYYLFLSNKVNHVMISGVNLEEVYFIDENQEIQSIVGMEETDSVQVYVTNGGIKDVTNDQVMNKIALEEEMSEEFIGIVAVPVGTAEYYDWETVYSSDYKVYAYYADGSVEQVSAEECTVIGAETSVYGDCMAKIEYAGFETDIAYTVIEDNDFYAEFSSDYVLMQMNESKNLEIDSNVYDYDNYINIQSENEEVITMCGTYAVAVSEGVARIALYSKSGEELDAMYIYVNEKGKVQRAQISMTNIELDIGEELQLKVTNVYPQTVKNYPVIWSVDDEYIVSVNQEGYIKAYDVGTTTVVCDIGGIKKSVEVVVKEDEGLLEKDEDEDDSSGDNQNTAQDNTQQTTTQQQTTEQIAMRQDFPAVGTKKELSSGQFKVTKSNASAKEVTFVKPKNNKKTFVSIPSTVKIEGYNYKVTAIADKAFKNNKKLKSVTIGKNVKKIGKEAFHNCKKLKKITIKSVVLKSVGKNAIKNIYKKATIKVPKKQLKKYKKLFKSKTGYKKTMKIKK